MRQRLSDSIADFDMFRKSEGKARNTRANDRQTLLSFLADIGNIYTHNVTERHVSEYLARRTDTRGAGALSVDVTVLNVFFKWCRRTKRIPRDSDPMAGRKTPRRVTRERVRLHVSKFPALLDAAEQRCPRDRAFIALGLYTLCRASEIETIRVCDLQLDNQRIRVRIHKQGTEDSLPISAELDQEMRRWLTTYTKAVGPLQPDYALVPARRLNTLNGATGNLDTTYIPTRHVRRTSSLVIQPALRSVGFVVPDQDDLKGEGEHTIRRSGARALFDRLSEDGYDHPLRIVQTMLHHKNLAQTEHYIGLTADRHTRDQLLAGEPMYDVPQVTRLQPVRDGATQ